MEPCHSTTHTDTQTHTQTCTHTHTHTPPPPPPPPPLCILNQTLGVIFLPFVVSSSQLKTMSVSAGLGCESTKERFGYLYLMWRLNPIVCNRDNGCWLLLNHSNAQEAYTTYSYSHIHTLHLLITRLCWILWLLNYGILRSVISEKQTAAMNNKPLIWMLFPTVESNVLFCLASPMWRVYVECVLLMAGLQPHLAWVRLIGLWLGEAVNQPSTAHTPHTPSTTHFGVYFSMMTGLCQLSLAYCTYHVAKTLQYFCSTSVHFITTPSHSTRSECVFPDHVVYSCCMCCFWP